MSAGQVTVDAGVLQAALLQMAEATQAAAAAAQTAGAQPQSSSTSSAQTGKGQVDWSKLLNRPSNFGEGKSVEDDVRNFKDWCWQLQQYFCAIDEGFQEELSQLMQDPTKPLSMDSATAETRNRSNKLYSLLAGLMKNRCLHILKSAPSGDGYEGLRQLVLAMRPPVQYRGLALLSAVTAGHHLLRSVHFCPRSSQAGASLRGDSEVRDAATGQFEDSCAFTLHSGSIENASQPFTD